MNGGELTLRNSSLSHNAAVRGGGICVDGGSLTVENSTFFSNLALVNGGGLFNGGGTVTISNSTFSRNTASSDGGGLNNASGSIVVANSTLTANRIGNEVNNGGGVSGFRSTRDSDVITLISTIVAGNFKGDFSDPADIGGGVDVSASTNNLIGDAATSGGLVHGQNGNIVGNNGAGTLDPDSILDPTASTLNGGVTRTHALVAGSLAIDAGSNPNNLAFDQRGMGFTRTVGLQTDIGAFERQAVVVDDDGAGDFLTIQAAINATPAGDTILVTGGADRIHTEQGITVNKSLTIQGEIGETQVIVQAAATPLMASRGVFDTTFGTTVAFDNLTIRHGGLAPNAIGQVGGITSQGSLRISNSTISNHLGRGIFAGAPITTSFVTISRSTISHNLGGGVSVSDNLTLTDSLISHNTANQGAGLILDTTATIINSTISHNFAQQLAGAMVVSGSKVTIINSTISQNSSGLFTGGIYGSGNVTLRNSTVTGNISQSAFLGSGIHLVTGTLDLISNIIAGNTVNGTTPSEIGSMVANAANNLIGDANSSGGILHGQNGNIVGNNGVGTIDIDTVLDTTLRDNGGPTPTHALVSGSLAINAGLNPQRTVRSINVGRHFPASKAAKPISGPLNRRFLFRHRLTLPIIPALAIGTGGGIQAQVRVFNSALDEVFRLFPYGDFGGGVRVALGDVTGDGVTDVITAAGTGGGPHVKVFDGRSGQQFVHPIGSFFAYGPEFLGGVFVAVADLNDDGRADIITGADAGGGPHVRAFSGADGSLLFDFFVFDPGFRGGVRVAAGDINLDGRFDIITSAGPGGGPHVRVFDGTNSLLASQGINIAGPLGSFFAYEATYTGGVFVAADNANAFPDDTPGSPLVLLRGPLIITGSGVRIGGPAVGLFSPVEPPEYFQLPQYSEVRVALFDFNGDGGDDYLTATGPRANGQIQLYSGDDTGTPLPFGPLLSSFFPFGELYRGGIFVAGSI